MNTLYKGDAILDISHKCKVLLDGHTGGFLVFARSGSDAAGQRCIQISLSDHAEKQFSVFYTTINHEVVRLFDELVNKKDRAKVKLEGAATAVLAELSHKEQLWLFMQMYKAGRCSGREDIRSRFHQLMASRLQYE